MSEITIVKTAEDQASRVLQVTVPVDRVKAAETKAVRHYASRVRLPGFRPGKAPEAVVRKRLHEEIRQAVLQEIIREGWDVARQSESLKPVADPAVRNLKFEEGQPVEFELFVEVKPELTLERLGGFTVSRTVDPVTDEQIAEQLERLREQKASWLPVDGAKPTPGQMVSGEVAPMEGDVVHAAKPFSMTLGSGQAVPALEEQIMTMLPGETAEADIRFPDDYPDESRRGQTRRVRITLADVKRQELPPLDDALAREVGDFETLDALKSAVREDLEQDAARAADSRVREELVNLLAEANNVVAPPSMIERALQAFAYAYQIPAEQYDGFTAQFRPIALQQVRRDLVLNAVSEQQQLRATEAELDERIASIAGARGSSPAEVYKSLEEAKRLPELERSITEEKVFAYLLSQSTVTEVRS
jgi:trigger factor